MHIFERKYHIAFGKHSNIPDCCINFFVDEWDEKDLWKDITSPFVIATQASKVQYVRCPECLGKGIVVTLHYCSGVCSKNFQATWGPE